MQMQVPRLAAVPSSLLRKAATPSSLCHSRTTLPVPIIPRIPDFGTGDAGSSAPSVMQLLVPLAVGRAARRGIAAIQPSTSHSSSRISEIDPGPQLASTENGAMAFATSGQACVDFLFRVVPGMKQKELLRLLRSAWNEDPLTATKLVMQLGDPRQGKSNRDNHQLCLLWLWRNFPATVLANIRSGALSHHTCMKGMLDLLMYAAWDAEDFLSKDLAAHPDRGTVGPQRQERKSAAFLQEKKLNGAARRAKEQEGRAARIKAFCEKLAEEGLGKEEDFRVPRKWRDESVPKRMPWIEKEEWISDKIKAKFADYCEKVDWEKNAKLHAEAKERISQQRLSVRKLYATDANLRELYDTVADEFANSLQELCRILHKHSEGQELTREERLALTGSLVPKWAPTSQGMHDKRTDIVQGIVERLFPKERYMIPDGTFEDYVSRMKDKYRQEVLTPLRKLTEVPESCVGREQWGEVNYNRMASRCRLLYGQSVYAKHDPERYAAHIEMALTRKGGVKGGAVMPHELVYKVLGECSKLEEREVEAQWRDLVADVRESGALGQCLAVCDVSGSMYGTPMNVAIALSLLVSEVAEGPWNGKICTFSRDPEFVTIPSGPTTTLSSRAKATEDLDWGMNTDFLKVFTEMLRIAVENGVPGEKMPKTLFVFSDMQFDQATCDGYGNNFDWSTTHQQILQKFRTAGYGLHVPEIVYWNLRDSCARGRLPTMANQEGVVMLSGFSQGMLKSFLSNKLPERTSPLEQLRAMIESEYYDKVVVASEDLPQAAPRPGLAEVLFS
ncbi:unnamed protein product [Symbiodinium necroappetens]|uniref:Uncharacterized protein n=1 Tax=Symbiodinium necroappetens TaxID=1628268 RepID=A0A812PKW5_9DINO|nr:unnamed protein product [Symbiodinium necroappetens]|mmetsp:Transcript_69508/g.165758  ORF Transcript_69508/g.165758 Transcript_69508/m.165758 type:complete len:787 (+) Transcript_69508:66-2426(+)|eukprot:CAMPEP_0181431324 /NCGR_PEP_ID=MMETSP1110-20121109/18186_1 /TAXON_ID=174948 /ORGANISM="Symbiodinium sp., Strain CCMP421" /LENGTH=786 /DNA_ID=CAMNT_0023554679 /DNA_START=45 /DNA_END=2405 /DNA_ORIENTATION=+